MSEEKRPSALQTEDQRLKMTTDEPLEDTPESRNINNIKELLNHLGRSALWVNRLDYYGNSIPIGAFCNAVAFILVGFERVHTFTKDEFLQGVLLIFGSLGQITCGLLEYIKLRSYSALLYLTLGFYCFSQFFIEDSKERRKNNSFFGMDNGDYEEIAFYYGAWFIIFLPLVLASLKVNIFFLLQTASTCFFFLFRWIGEKKKKKGIHDYTAGIFQLIAGFTSLYIFAYQIINEQWAILPSISLNKENDVDLLFTPEEGTPQ